MYRPPQRRNLMSYRNKEWYLIILKGKTAEWAYRYITDNLRQPSFVHEPSNAFAAYREVFGVDFSSPEEMKAISQAEEIERLKAELELAKIAKKQETVAEKKEVAVDKSTETDLLTKEQFKASRPDLKGISIHHGWTKYKKEHGIVE
jgi:hypothetical protein